MKKNVAYILFSVFCVYSIFTALTSNKQEKEPILSSEVLDAKNQGEDSVVSTLSPINPGSKSPSQPASDTSINALNDFDAWFVKFDTEKSNRALVEEGIELAKARRVFFEKEIIESPRKALSRALSYAEYDALPPEIQEIVEKPISVEADLDILPIENLQSNISDQGDIASIQYQENGENFYHRVTLFGDRKNILSKQSLAVQGIRLGKIAAIRDDAFQALTATDVDWAKKTLPIGNSDIARDHFTQASIDSDPVVAVSQGKAYYFSARENIRQLNIAINQLEIKAGPKSHLLQQSRFAASGAAISSGSSLQEVLAPFILEASPWTETNKKVFFIRIDFSDEVGESITQAALASRLNGSVAAQIADFSYGKTTIEGAVDGSLVEVSAQVVRVPGLSTYYKNLDLNSNSTPGSGALYTAAIAEFNLLNTGVNLDDFDIVGIHFAEIGLGYAGLATIGGSKHWLQNTSSSKVIVHEFGHNYGLSHANYWDTSGSSVVGAGSELSYGDIYDTMGSGEGDFHIQAKSRLNWIPTTEWLDVSSSGSYRIHRFDQGTLNTNNKALRLTKGIDEYYWLGYRRDFTSNNVLQKGAYIIWQGPNSNRSMLIDTTPGSLDGKNDAGISLGRTYSDPTASLHITPTTVGGSGDDEWIDIEINIGAFSGNQDPVVSLTAPSALNARQALSFSAGASDPDGDTLAYAWDFGDGVIHTNTGSVEQTWTVGGSYTVSVTVSDMKGGVATDTLNVTVTDPVTTWSDRTSNVSDSLVDIATDGNTAIAITNFAVIGSTDGVTWTQLDARQTSGTGLGYNTYLYSIIYDGNQWVAVGQDHNGSWEGAIYTSPNGSDWTQRHLGGDKLRSIASSGSILVAVGDNGAALRSADGGNTWTPVPSNVSTKLINITYGNSTFVAVGNQYISGDLSAMTTSSDGLTWTNITSQSGVAAAAGYNSLEYLNDKFVGSGYNSKLGYLENSGSSAFISTRSNREVTPAMMYGAEIYFAAGINQSDSGNDIDLVSLDGKSWFVSPSTSSVDNRNSGVFFKNTFITVGKGGSIRQSGVMTVAVSDADSDGQDDSREASVPNAAGAALGDGNGDGTADGNQGYVTSLKSNDDNYWLTFTNTADASQTNFSTAAAPTTLPADHQLMLGAVQFDITSSTGATLSIEVYVDQDTAIADYLLLGSDGSWHVQNATVTHTGNKTKLAFSVTEGGNFDRDGAADGTLQLAQGGVMVKTGFAIYPHAHLFGSVDLTTQTAAKTFTLSNTGSRVLTLATVTLTGNDAAEFIIDADSCVNQTLNVGDKCQIAVRFQPTSIGSKAAQLSIQTDDPDNAKVNIFLRNHEADEEESARRLPPVLNAFSIENASGQVVSTMQVGTSYTVKWSILGYHADYSSLLAIFDCRGIADNTTCGDSYSGAKFLATASLDDDGAPVEGHWKSGSIQSQVFSFSHTFTTPMLTEAAPVVIRFYRKNIDDQHVGNRSLSLIIPGNQADAYYDTTGRRLKNTIALP